MPKQLTKLTETVWLYNGSVTTGIVLDGNRALLIDAGRGVAEALSAQGLICERVLVTHHHRDQVPALLEWSGELPALSVPEDSRDLFANVESFWQDPERRWHLYNYHPLDLVLPTSLPVAGTLKNGDEIIWGKTTIRVIATPGHTDDHLSYAVETASKRITFCGDVLAGEGVLWDVYSLQKGIPGTIKDYHGFLGSREELCASLHAIRTADMLIPAHGKPIHEVSQAVERCCERIERCYENYVSVQALRHYFPQMFTAWEGHEEHLPIRPGIKPPDYLYKSVTTWMLRSACGEVLVLDCGAPEVLTRLEELTATGEISGVSEAWVTHYHDDHVNSMREFQTRYPCPTRTTARVAEVIEEPRKYRLPCQSPVTVRVDQCVKHGESWTWNEFTLTGYDFPGQTLYHAGLFVEGRGLRLFFAGDSFTMAGLDDYCAGNRNFLGAGRGYLFCLDLIRELQPTHIFNCHVDDAFRFTDAEIDFMQTTLRKRESLLGELSDWGQVNFATDPHWARGYPFEQDGAAGQVLTVGLDITNHAAETKTATVKPILPSSPEWGEAVAEKSVAIAAGEDARVSFTITIPPTYTPTSKTLVIPFDLNFAGRDLPLFRECIVRFGECCAPYA